jgi:hypothetical protein
MDGGRKGGKANASEDVDTDPAKVGLLRAHLRHD